VGGAVQICGWCSTNMWVVQYKYVGGAVQICGWCSTNIKEKS